MSDDNPEDINVASRALVDALNELAVTEWTTTDLGQLIPDLVLPTIARAILAERVATTSHIADFVEAKMSDVDPELGDFIAAAIRSGARP